ncbi:hypothetical protein ACQZ4R_20745 [Agrobacterium vitis]
MMRAESNFFMATRIRTDYANRIFKPSLVATAIDEVAVKGFRQFRIVQEFPFNLSDTDAAKALEEWLGREQFHYVWRPTYIEQNPFRPQPAIEYPELTITW